MDWINYETGIKQRDSLSPFLFIKKVKRKTKRGYRMDRKELKRRNNDDRNRR
jgi:hypothetical protein